MGVVWKYRTKARGNDERKSGIACASLVECAMSPGDLKRNDIHNDIYILEEELGTEWSCRKRAYIDF
jgi:hypothetical protein